MPTIFHPHGIFHTSEDRCLAEESIATGVEGIQFAEENDLGLLKGLCRGKVCVLGGVNVFTTLLLGPEDRIANETRGFLETCAPGAGYTFMCSCSLHRGIRIDHVETMMRTCRSHGAYR